MKTFFLCLVFLQILTLSSQETIDFNDYQPLLCQGEIPDDFKKDIAVMIEQAKAEGQSSDNPYQKLKLEHLEGSRYALNNILYSGRILYGDILTQYVNRVADAALKSEPALRQKLRFYVLKSSEVNAHCFEGGVIFINIGLLSQIENEAQLAFVICHEAVHFRNNHHFDSYNRNQKVATDRNKLTSNEDKLKDMLRYEKEQEFEADKQGMEIFLKSPYPSKGIEGTFDMLLYSYLPFDDIIFSSTYFNDSTYNLPSKYFPVETRTIVSREKVSDSASTHPNIHRRKELALRVLEDAEPKNGVSYVDSKYLFELVQRAARCEVATINIRDGESAESFYNAYLLERLYGKTLYGDKIMSAALYTQAKIKNHDYQEALDRKKEGLKPKTSFKTTTPKWERIEGASQTIHHFFYKIPALELNILAARVLYDFNKGYNDFFFQVRFSEMISEAITIHHIPRSSFIVKSTAAIPEPDSVSNENNRNQKLKGKENLTIHYYSYAFMDCGKDKYFRMVYNRQEDIRDSIERRNSDASQILFVNESDKVLKKYGPALDISKATFIAPSFSSYTYRYVYTDTFSYYYTVRDKKVGYMKEMKIEKDIAAYMMDYARSLNLQADILGNNIDHAIETDKFNRFQQLMNWSYEKFSQGETDAIAFNQQNISDLTDGTRYLGFFRIIKEYKVLTVRFILIDLQTGKAKVTYDKELIKAGPESVQLRAIIYEILDHIKQSPDRINALKVKYNIHD